MVINVKKIVIFFGLIAILAAAPLALANWAVIDVDNHYAWSENGGWVNFRANPNTIVRLNDSEMTGYAWSENFGWINLNPPTAGVRNNGKGHLSGYAWGENSGWINFTGVNIDPLTGEFFGYASSSALGRISFNCSNTNSCGQSDFKIKTTWRAINLLPATSSLIIKEPLSGGGTAPASRTLPLPPNPVQINNGLGVTIYSRFTTLSLNGGPEAVWVKIANDVVLLSNAVKQPYLAELSWELLPGIGQREVYVEFSNSDGSAAATASAGVYLEESKSPLPLGGGVLFLIWQKFSGIFQGLINKVSLFFSVWQ